MSWDFPSFIVGLIIGAVIILFIIWILYISRAFVFSNCNIQYPICTENDYYEDPSGAILNGYNADDILFIAPDSSGIPTMTYERVPRVNTCTPSSVNQIVTVQYPQWCMFTDTANQTYQSENIAFDSPVYSYKDSMNNTITVTTYNGGQCKPKTSTGSVVVSGTPVLKWLPY